MAFYKGHLKRVGTMWGQYRKKRVLHLGGLILAAGVISVFYSNCGDFSALKNAESNSIQLTNGEQFFSNGEVVGFVEGMVDTGSTLVLSGWACVVGSNSSAILEIGASGGGSFGTAEAENIREDEVKLACNSNINNHGFSFEISAAQRNANDGKQPYAKLNGKTIPLFYPNLIITAVPPEPVNPNSSLPITVEMTPWTGPGGSTWNHRVTLKEMTSDGFAANFSVYSSSSNSALIPSFFEQQRDVSLFGVIPAPACHTVAEETRTITSSGDTVLVIVQACFTKHLGTKDWWSVTFAHLVENKTNPNASSAGFGSSHGRIDIHP